MKITVFEAESWEREAFESLADEHELVCTEDPLDDSNAAEFADSHVISTFVYSELGEGVLREFDDLRQIATRSTGYDHIDRETCEQRQITVSNVPTYGDNTVAEHVFGLLLTISHHLWHAIDRTRKGDFSQQGLRGFDLLGKTMGVVGTGAIGSHVVKIARGFGMEVLGHDVEENEELVRSHELRYLPLGQLLERSDIVSLNVPLDDDTRHLIGDDEFARMKKGVVLINTARGAVVDIKALVRALADGTVAAAGLDVLPEEPVIREEAELLRSMFRAEHDLEALLADHVLLRLRNVFITPHSAFNTREAVQRILDTTVENIECFLEREPQNVVMGPREAGVGSGR